MDETGKAEFEAVACNKVGSAVPLLICIVFGFIHQSTCIFSLEGSLEKLCQMSYNIENSKDICKTTSLSSLSCYFGSQNKQKFKIPH
jgi:hypothetical protein